MAEEPRSNNAHPMRQYVDDFLSVAAPGLQEVVNSKSFGAMVSQTASNLVAVQRIGHEVSDLVLRNARIAGRADVTSLHRQLARTEDKLEAVLETVERLEDELADERRRSTEPTSGSAADGSPGAKPAGRSGRSSSSPSPRRVDNQGE
ncbi:hypothetical protein GCM10022261_24680 [Brevibacterium daeguense]|uniref:Uncharacterized protein n=1 Tax=Brevibacterium daeguense TaxID=909936 RepID=A0ABP8ELV2_9MICO|nr:hypothetical protein [Brevibacterium daeguense]